MGFRSRDEKNKFSLSVSPFEILSPYHYSLFCSHNYFCNYFCNSKDFVSSCFSVAWQGHKTCLSKVCSCCKACCKTCHSMINCLCSASVRLLSCLQVLRQKPDSPLLDACIKVKPCLCSGLSLWMFICWAGDHLNKILLFHPVVSPAS